MTYFRIGRKRPGWESNPRIRVLQTLALPLGYQAVRTHLTEIRSGNPATSRVYSPE